jgi:hypothetical protein
MSSAFRRSSSALRRSRVIGRPTSGLGGLARRLFWAFHRGSSGIDQERDGETDLVLLRTVSDTCRYKHFGCHYRPLRRSVGISSPADPNTADTDGCRTARNSTPKPAVPASTSVSDRLLSPTNPIGL